MLIGGHVALDLVNTVSWRQDPNQRRENLAAPRDLLAWARRATVLDQHPSTRWRSALGEDPETAERVLRGVRELREALHHHLDQRIAHGDAEQHIAPGSPLHRAFADAITASSLAGTPARWTGPARTPLELPRVLALHALDLLQTMPVERLRRCEDDSCGWLFLDATRNHSRRWCRSGDCGNRNRARRHYARSRTTER